MVLLAAVTIRSFCVALSQTLPKENILRANIINITVSERLSCKNGLNSFLKIHHDIKCTTGNRKLSAINNFLTRVVVVQVLHMNIHIFIFHILLSYLWVAAMDIRIFFV